MCNTQSLSWNPCTSESGMHNYLELWEKWMESASLNENQMLHAREMCEWPKEPAQIYVQSGRGWWEFIATLKLAQILLARARVSGRVTQSCIEVILSWAWLCIHWQNVDIQSVRDQENVHSIGTRLTAHKRVFWDYPVLFSFIFLPISCAWWLKLHSYVHAQQSCQLTVAVCSM